jgi:hypothetical protein
MLLNKAGTTLIGYPTASGTLNLDGITKVGDYAFSSCSNLVTVTLPAAQTIGDSAFESCSGLKTVNLPKAHTISGWAFSGCDALETVTLPAVQSIGDSVFAYAETDPLTVILGDTVPTLGKNLFNGVKGDKTVTVTVPNNANWNGKTGSFTSTNSTVNWGNGFRGGGWDGATFTAIDKISSYITLTIQNQ